MKNIYLCGFMGVGKSTIGKRLASKLGISFLDTDQKLESQTGKSITQIFLEDSEQTFRAMEHALLQQLSQTKNTVISLGGGTLFFPGNAELTKQNGRLIYLELPFSICYERIQLNCKKRPLALQKSRAELETLYQTRHDLYQNIADLVIDANASVEICAQNIKETILLFK